MVAPERPCYRRLMAKIEDILSQRTDLSTFLVHMTKDTPSVTALDVLKNILKSGELRTRTAFGHAVMPLRAAGLPVTSQQCVCFTETPLVHLRLILGEIDGRNVPLKPYGVAFPKKIGRQLGLNPVWYIDMSPGRKGWLSEHWNELISSAIDSHKSGAVKFEDSPVARLTPFVEQMYTYDDGRRKEFWWEREWRKREKLILPTRFIVIAPEKSHASLREFLTEQKKYSSNMPLIDANWSLEQVIGGLAGFRPSDLGL